MYEKGTVTFLYALMPLHSGAGSGVGTIDLPIQREVFSHIPIIQASGLKGALRAHFEQTLGPALKEEIFAVFGPDTASAAENAGAFGIEEAKLLLFPVRSLKGVFLYLTCPFVLARLKRDLEILTHLTTTVPGISGWAGLTGCHIPENTVWLGSENSPALTSNHKVILEECMYSSEIKQEVDSLATWLNGWLGGVALNLAGRLAVVPDDLFIDSCEFATEVVTRNRIDASTGTVETGGLWSEEHLPRESVLYSLALATKPHRERVVNMTTAQQVLEFVAGDQAPEYLWVGGDQTVGRGLVRMIWKLTPPGQQ